jgi:hypothetical protein
LLVDDLLSKQGSGQKELGKRVIEPQLHPAAWPTSALLKSCRHSAVVLSPRSPSFLLSSKKLTAQVVVSKKRLRPEARMMRQHREAELSAPASTSIRQPDGSPDASFSNLALQIPNVFSFSPPSPPGLINDCKGLTGQTSRLLNFIKRLTGLTGKIPQATPPSSVSVCSCKIQMRLGFWNLPRRVHPWFQFCTFVTWLFDRPPTFRLAPFSGFLPIGTGP